MASGYFDNATEGRKAVVYKTKHWNPQAMFSFGGVTSYLLAQAADKGLMIIRKPRDYTYTNCYIPSFKYNW